MQRLPLASASGRKRLAPNSKMQITPNASPALMAGWKLEFGMRYKGVLFLLDYQALREGKVVIAQAPDREAYARDKIAEGPCFGLCSQPIENSRSKDKAPAVVFIGGVSPECDN